MTTVDPGIGADSSGLVLEPAPDGAEPSVLVRGGTAGGRLVDVVIAGGVIESVSAAATSPHDAAFVIDATGMVVLPSFVEPHAHLDKALTANELPNEAGDLASAIRVWIDARGRQTVEAMTRRAGEAALRLVANGTTTIRTHCDTGEAMGLRAMEALLTVKADLAHLVDIQLVANCSIPVTGRAGATNRSLFRDAVALGADAVGGAPYLDEDPEAALHILADRAVAAGIPLDLHVDETIDSATLTLPRLIMLARAGFPQPITAGHCVSLGVQTPAVQEQLAYELAEAGIGVVALPQTNLYLQGRTATTATSPPRAIAPVRTLLAAGALVAAGGDNVQDPFNPLGRSDPLETAALLVAAGHVPALSALGAITSGARRVVGVPDVSVLPGDPADLVLVRTLDESTAIATGEPCRIVIRRGRVVARTDVQRWVASPFSFARPNTPGLQDVLP